MKFILFMNDYRIGKKKKRKIKTIHFKKLIRSNINIMHFTTLFYY